MKVRLLLLATNPWHHCVETLQRIDELERAPLVNTVCFSGVLVISGLRTEEFRVVKQASSSRCRMK